MNEAFFALESEKRERILNAALDEFAAQGYEKASTNRITKEAGISKGVLFYYFGSKRALYGYLAELSMDIVYDAYLRHIGGSGDFIERYSRMASLKRRAMREAPHAFAFFSSLYLRPAEGALSEELAGRVEAAAREGRRKLYENIDTSLFRGDIPPERIIQMVRYCMDGYAAELEKELSDWRGDMDADFQEQWDRFYAFLDDMRKAFYRAEGKNERD